jgi:hypothetical protein
MPRNLLATLVCCAMVVGACKDDSKKLPPDSATAADLQTLDVMPDIPFDLSVPEVQGPETVVEPALAICTYVNPFSKGDECKEYTGAGWTVDAATADCGNVLLGEKGTFKAAANCGFASELGRCIVAGEGDTDYVLVSAGDDAGACSSAQAGCEIFGGGSWEPAPLCDGSVNPPPTGGYGTVPFIQPYQVCKDPIAGQAPGQSDGKVCTWTLISGCTEAGRKFSDYASCDDVRTQRPYYGAPEEANTPSDDPRLDDPDYMAELAWAKSQVEAAACACCHSEKLTPDGPSWWYIEAEPIWLDSVRDSGLAMMAGLADSTALGAYPADMNNGFDRTTLGLPTNDIPRMQAFLLGEWARRGYTEEEGKAVAPFGGPIYDQLIYEPGACQDGQGVQADGTMVWTGGEARYAYILAADATSPGVPPNLDEPEGSLWFVDVATEADPFASGIKYGEVTGDLEQRIPAQGAPEALADGTTYYIYVLKDIGFPIARCLFTYPAP